MNSITPRQRVEAVLTGKGHPDSVPLTMYENKQVQCAAERALRNTGMCIVNRKVPVYKIHNPNVKFHSITRPDDRGRMLTTNYYETPQGTLSTVTEKAGFTSWTHEHLFKTPDDYPALLFMINDMAFEPDYEAFNEAQHSDGGDSIFRGAVGSEPLQSLISYYMGSMAFCIEWMENRDEVLRLYHALTEKRREVYPILAQSPALHFNYGGNVAVEIIGPRNFEEYYVPHYNEAAEVLHRHGKLLGCHFDGNCKAIAKTIADSALDYIEAFTPAPDTDMTLAEAFEAWPDKVLWINFPSSVHVRSISEVEQVTRDLLAQADGNRHRLIMGITEDIPEERWRENMLTISRVLSDRFN